MKNSNDIIGNRNRDLPTWSAVPQPTALPRAPISQGTYSINLCYNPVQLLFVALQFSPKSMKNYTMHCFNHLQPTGYVMRQQFNIQQLYALPTLYLCVLYLSENKQRLVPLTA